MFANTSRARWNPLAAPWTQWLRRRPDADVPRQQSARPSPPVAINLIAAQRSRAIVDLRFAGIEGIFQSTLAEVDTESGLIRIDECFPEPGAARPGQAVTVSLRLGNRREQFDTRVAARYRVGDVERYALHLPPTVGYEQRRGAYRLPLRASQLPCRFIAAGFRYHAEALDISPLGIRLELREWRPLPVGSVLENLEFELLGQHFDCAATVRNTCDCSDGGTQIGAMFIDLSRGGQRELERLIMRLQRRQLQRAQALARPSATLAGGG